MDISDLNNSEITATMGSVLSTSNENETQNLQEDLITEESNLTSQNIEVIEPQITADSENLSSTVLDTIEYTTETLSEQDLNLILRGKPSTSSEPEELISSSNNILDASSSSNIEEHEELWLGDNTRQLVKVDTDEDFEVIVKSLETAIVETERYDIENIITSSNEPILSSVTSENSLGITIDPEPEPSESLLEDIPSNLLTSAVPPFPSQGLRLPESIGILSSDPVGEHNIDTYEEFATISEPKVESFDEQTSSLFEDQIPIDNGPSLLELQEATMPSSMPEVFPTNLQFTASRITIENELDDDLESVEEEDEFNEETQKSESEEENISIKIVNVESQAESNNDETNILDSISETVEENLLFSEIENVAEVVPHQTDEETLITSQDKNINTQNDNQDIDLQPIVDESLVPQENQIIISEVRTLQILEDTEQDTSNKDEDINTEKDDQEIDLEPVPDTSEVLEENQIIISGVRTLQIPEESASEVEELDATNNDEDISQIEKQDIDLEPIIDTPEIQEENQIIISEVRTLEISEEIASKEEGLETANIDEDIVQKENDDIVLEPIIHTTEVAEENSFVISEVRTMEIPEETLSKAEELDTTNNDEKAQKENEDIDLELTIDTAEVAEENSFIISEVRTMEISEESVSEAEELDTSNNDENILEENKDSGLEPVVAEENSYIISEVRTMEIPEESVSEAEELDTTNNDENIQKENDDIDLDPTIETTQIVKENSFIISEVRTMEIPEESESVSEAEELDTTNSDEIIQKENEDNDLEPIIDTPAVAEEDKFIISEVRTLLIPEESASNIFDTTINEEINIKNDNQDLDPVLDKSEDPELSKIILSEETQLQVPEESVPNVEETNIKKDNQDTDLESIIKTSEDAELSKIILSEETLLQVSEESVPNVKEINIKKGNQDTDLKPVVDTSEDPEFSKTILSKETLLQVPEESVPKVELPGTSNKDKEINVQKDIENIVVEAVIDTTEIPEENEFIISEITSLQIPEENVQKVEKASNKDKEINVQKDIENIVAESVIDTTEIPEENKFDISEITLQIPEENVQKVDEPSNKDEDLNAQKDNQNIVAEPVIDRSEILEESSSKIEELDATNKDEDIIAPKENKEIDLEPVIDTAEIPDKNKIILPEETILPTPKESEKKVEDLTNKDKAINSPKDNKNVDLESVINAAEVLEENKIILSEDTLQVPEETAPKVEELINKDEDMNAQKDNQNIDLGPVIDKSEILEETIIKVPEESISKSEELDTINKDKDNNSKKDDEVIDLELKDKSEVLEESKIILSEESVSKLKELDTTNKNETDTEKDKHDIDLKLKSDITEVQEENKIILSEGSVSQLDTTNKNETIAEKDKHPIDLQATTEVLEENKVISEKSVSKLDDLDATNKIENNVEKDNHDIDLEPMIDIPEIPEENKIILSEESVSKLEATNKNETNIEKANILEVPEEKNIFPEESVSKIGVINKNETNVEKDSEPIVDMPEVPEEKNILSEENVSKLEDLDATNKNEANAEKYSEPIADISEVSEETKIILSDESLLKLEDLDSTNKNETNAEKGSELTTDMPEVPKEKKIILSEENVSKLNVLDATNKSETNVEKKIESVADIPELPEEAKIILSEESLSKLEYLDATNKNETNAEKDSELTIDMPEVSKENKIILPEENASKLNIPDATNKSETNVEKNLESIAGLPEVPKETKIILSEESLTKLEDLDSTNKNETNAEKDSELTTDMSEVPKESKIILPGENLSKLNVPDATNKSETNVEKKSEPIADIPEVPEKTRIILSEETLSKLKDLDATNKNETIVEKDSEPIADIREVPEETKIILSEESVSKLDVLVNKTNAEKNTQDIDSKPISEIPEEKKIILPKENILQNPEETTLKVEEPVATNKVIEDTSDLQSSDSTSTDNSDNKLEANDTTKDLNLNKDVLSIKDCLKLKEPSKEIGESSSSLKHSLEMDVKDQSPPKRIKLVRAHFHTKTRSQGSQKDVESERKTSSLDKEEKVENVITPAPEQKIKIETITKEEKHTEGKETIQELLAKLEDPEDTKSSESKTPVKRQKLKLQRNYKLPKKTIKHESTIKRVEKQITVPAKTPTTKIKPIHTLVVSKSKSTLKVHTSTVENIKKDILSTKQKTESVLQSKENVTKLESKICEFKVVKPNEEKKEEILSESIYTVEMKDDIQTVRKEETMETQIVSTSPKCDENMDNKNILMETQSEECILESDKTTPLVDVNTNKISIENIEITDNSQVLQLDNVESDNILSEREINVQVSNICTEDLSMAEQISSSEHVSTKNNENLNIEETVKENLIENICVAQESMNISEDNENLNENEALSSIVQQNIDIEHNIPQEHTLSSTSVESVTDILSINYEEAEREMKEPKLMPTETDTAIENLLKYQILEENKEDTEVILALSESSCSEDSIEEIKEDISNEIVEEICLTEAISTIEKETENLIPEVPKEEVDILQVAEKIDSEIPIPNQEIISEKIQNINPEFNLEKIQDTVLHIDEKQEIKSQINEVKQVKTVQNLDVKIIETETSKESLKIDSQFPLLSSRLREKYKPKKPVEEVSFANISFPTISHERVSKKLQDQLISESKEISKPDNPPVFSGKISSREVTLISRNPEITFTKEIASSSQDHSATMESATKIKITKKRLGTPEPTVTRSVTKPLSVQVDDLESSNTVERSHSAGASSQKDTENMKYVIKSLKGEGRSSPKITIKPIKPPEEISGKSRSEELSHSPKITIKPIVKSDPLKITITKQKSDDSHSILKIYQPEDSQAVVGEHVPKLTIKPIQRSDEMQHSPRITIKPVKPSPTTSSMSPKITVKPIQSPSEQVEIIHSPKITVKPVVNPEESYPKVTIKPVLRPEESHKVSQLSPRQIKLKSMTFESSSGVTVEPICGTSQQKADPESQTGPCKISVKPFAKIEESLSPKLTIKPITKTCEIVQSEDGTSNPLKLTIKPIMKPEESSYQSPKITIKPIVKPDEVNSPQSEEIDKPERIILKIQKNNLPSPKERIKESKKEPEIKIEAVPHDSEKNQKLDKIKLKLTKEGSHAQIIPSVSQISSESTISLKRSLCMSDSGVLEKRSKTEFPGTELLHTSDISINLVEPNAKPNMKTISEEVTIMKIDKTSGTKEPVTEKQISQSRFKEMLMKIQQKPDITCTPKMEQDPEYSSGSDDVRIVEVTQNDSLKESISLLDESSSQDVMIINEVINTNPFQNIQIMNTETPVQTPKKRGRPRKNPLEVKPEIKGEDCVEVVRPKRTCRAPPGRTPFAVKERKPRGAGRGRGGSRGRGASKSPQKSPKEAKTTPRGKALKEAKELAKIEATRLAEEIVIDEITIEDSTNDTPITTPVPPVEDSPKKPEVKEVEPEPEPEPEPPAQMPEPEPEVKEVLQSQVQVSEPSELKQPPPPAVYEEETRMSADNSSRAQTPARQVFTAPLAEGPEESQSSVQSTATTESSKTKKGRLEICDPDSAVTTVEQIVEYSWANGGPYMLQEQIAQFLGVKSFKRKYPGLTRRSVEMQERDYIREKGLVSESMCDMGLTAVPSSEILDIMFQDFQEKYEEYRKCLRDKQAKEISNKQKAVSLATSQEKNKIDFKEKAIRSAASWNVNFNKARKESRKCCMDLQTFTINYPAGKVKVPHKNPVGHYPLALVPGQYTDFYKSYTPSELHYLPLNTVRYGPVLPNQRCEPGQSDGSQSDSDSSSGSDSDSSDDSMTTEDETPAQVLSKTVEVQLTQLTTTPKSKVH